MRDKLAVFARTNPALIATVALFILLATIYSITTPIFEAGDEIWHYPFIQHLATGHGLPVQDPAVKTLWEQEGGQPPLYYAVGAAATAWIDTGDLGDRLWTNPHAKIGIPLVLGNKNMVVHTSAESFPWRGATLAVHLLRFLSILFSAGTVVLTYLLALEIRPDRRFAAAVAAIVAVNPMFLFISASVNNDNLAVLLATLALLLLVRLVTRRLSIRVFVVLGLVLGLAALTKVSNLGLSGLAGMVFLRLIWREWKAGGIEKARHIVWGSLLCGILVILIAGWWYVRNYALYGDPLAFNVWVAIAGGRPAPASLTSLIGELEGFIISFWGNFGGVNIIAPGWVYWVLDALTLLAAIGLLFGFARRTLPKALAIPGLWLAVICVSLVRWTWLTMASQGRLIFPAIAAVALLLVIGLEELGQALDKSRFEKWQRALPIVPVVFLLAFAALAPFLLITPAYALPVRLAENTAVPNSTHITFEDRAELIGYALPERAAAPGENLPLTLYWRALERMDEDFSVYIHLFDSNASAVGQWDAYPGGGAYPTRLWQQGEIIVDSYQVPITVTAKGPNVGRVEVGLYRKASVKNLVARDPQNRVVTPTLGRFKIEGEWNARISNPRSIDFAHQLKLAGFTLLPDGSSALRVGIYWQGLAAMRDDYTVFVHLLDAQGRSVAQKDDQPRQGAYPTSFWDVGEVVPDEYLLDLPEGLASADYAVEVGVYRLPDGARLPVVGGGDSVVLATVPIGR